MHNERDSINGTQRRMPNGRNDNEPPNPEGAVKATKENTLTRDHTRPGDGGYDNAAPQTQMSPTENDDTRQIRAEGMDDDR